VDANVLRATREGEASPVATADLTARESMGQKKGRRSEDRVQKKVVSARSRRQEN